MHAAAEGVKAVNKVNSHLSVEPGKASNSKRAGLTFPVSFTRGLLTMTEMRTKVFKRVGAGAGVYLAAVLEYLNAEILELAGNASRNDGKVTIAPKHIYLAVSNDEELDVLFNSLGIVLTEVPVLAGIPKQLLFSPDEKKKRAAERAKERKKSGTKVRKTKADGRFKVSGENTLKEVKKMQKSTDMVFPQAAFSRLVREISQEYGDDLRFSAEAMNIIQRGVEDHILKLYRIANKLAIHGKRRAVKPIDLQLARSVSDSSKLGDLRPSGGYEKGNESEVY